MALSSIEDIVKLEELLDLKKEIETENSLKSEILKEGIGKRLNDILAVQTTELGRIESNAPEFNIIYLRKVDAPEHLQDLPENKEKKSYELSMEKFIKELKIAFKAKLHKQLDDLNVKLEKINSLI